MLSRKCALFLDTGNSYGLVQVENPPEMQRTLTRQQLTGLVSVELKCNVWMGKDAQSLC